nr:MAG TPA: tail tube protein [Caudoviricetes sp.]
MARTIDRGNSVISGTFGELWLDGDLVAEVKGFQAKLMKNKEKVMLCGQLFNDTKVMSLDGKGSVTMYKVDSALLEKEADMQKGVDHRYTIISKLNDPDSFGAERVAVKNVSFDELTLADWKRGTIGEITTPFTFTGYELLDSIEEE